MLHLAEHGAAKGPTTPVEAPAILNAYRVGRYYKACAINTFAEMGTDQGTADALYLLERIKHLGKGEVFERDMHVAARSRFKTKAELLPALDRLIEYGFLDPLPAPMQTDRGRPTSPRYKVLPQATENT